MAIRSLAVAARKEGMKLLAFPQGLVKAGVDSPGYPMVAWYLVDEPDVRNDDPRDIHAMNQRTKRWDPDVPTALVIGEGEPAAKYGDITDVMMLDWYPVPHLPLDSVAHHLDLVRENVPKGKPIWMVLQAFDWRDYRQRDPAKPRIGRFPTREEIRFMSYLSVLHGAAGLFYFQLGKPGRGKLIDFPLEWARLRSVVRELAELRPVFEQGSALAAVFPNKEVGLEAGGWRYAGKDYVIALNRLKAQMVEVPGELLEPEWDAMFAGAGDVREALTQAEGRWYLAPHSVLIARK